MRPFDAHGISILAAEKLIRDCQVPVLSLDGTECNLRVGPCPECIIPDDWLETLTPDGTSINVSEYHYHCDDIKVQFCHKM